MYDGDDTETLHEYYVRQRTEWQGLAFSFWAKHTIVGSALSRACVYVAKWYERKAEKTEQPFSLG